MTHRRGAFVASFIPISRSGLSLSALTPVRPRLPQQNATSLPRQRARTSVEMSSTEPPEKPKEAPAPGSRRDSSRYWQGDWLCVDCGYTYKPGRKVKFEDLPASWKCPQCNAPKRRFAKKAGDYIAETAGTSNVPILVFSLVGLLATVLFGIWATKNL